MRYIVTKQHSTKAERIVYEILKELHIDFKHRWIVAGCEVDFIVGKYAIEIDGHPQDGYKNHHLVENGYTPLHLTNEEVYQSRDKIKDLIKKL